MTNSSCSYKIVKYTSAYYNQWNDFVSKAKNTTFLFHRDFMEYHKDRFEDYSLLIFKNEKLIALFPSNIKNDIIFSHQGLTYGGLLLQNEVKFSNVLECFYCLLEYLHQNHFTTLKIKVIPSIYSQLPTDETLYILFLLESELIKREALSVIKQSVPLKFSKNRIDGNKRAIKHGLEIKDDGSLDAFWNEILIPNLKNKHSVSPVHTLEEIKLLKKKFPNEIKQFNVYNNNKIVAGTTMFISKNVAHVQYISADSDKNLLGSLELLFQYLIKTKFTHKDYFDFGISNENEGKQINYGLQFWKEGFGARTILQDFYSVPIKNYKNLKHVMI